VIRYARGDSETPYILCGGFLVSYPLAAVPISSVADGRRGVSTKGGVSIELSTVTLLRESQWIRDAYQLKWHTTRCLILTGTVGFLSGGETWDDISVSFPQMPRPRSLIPFSLSRRAHKGGIVIRRSGSRRSRGHGIHRMASPLFSASRVDSPRQVYRFVEEENEKC
jgi:hypothetical protein